jgi:ER membrane protein complex subunit 1, C-terminal
MKYVNPHTVLLAYFSPKKTPAETGAGASASASAETSSSEGSPLYAAVVDTVSSKILYRVLLCNTASAPVHALLVENHVIVTYWNAKAKRTELSSTALYEGMVDVFGLSPLSYFAALPQQIRDANLSSFTSPIPLGIQRTYVIPRMVTSLHHTITSRGMTSQHQHPIRMPLCICSP